MIYLVWHNRPKLLLLSTENNLMIKITKLKMIKVIIFRFAVISANK